MDGVAVLPDRLEDLAAQYVEEMRGFQPEGPYHLLGLSFGGVIAFEMARQLAAQGQEVGMLALIDSYISRVKRRLPLRLMAANFMKLGPAEFVRRVKVRSQEMRERSQKAPYEPHIHHPWGVQDTLGDTYHPGTYAGKVIFFKALEVALTFFRGFEPPELGWQKWVTGGVEIHEIKAGHIEMLEEPHVQPVADILRANIRPEPVHTVLQE